MHEKLSNRPLFGRLLNYAVEATAFRHFCAGKNKIEALQKGRLLKSCNVYSIVDYAAEKTPMMQQAATFDFALFAKKTQNHLLESIDVAKEIDGAVALKVTCLIPFELLARASKAQSIDDLNVDLIESVVEKAAEAQVKVFIDAEQLMVQPAIDLIAIRLMQRFPGCVFNTYQMYLVDALPRLKAHYSLMRAANVPFSCKLVRGAYLEEEKRRCVANNVPAASLFCASIEETHVNFDAAVRFLVDRLAEDHVSHCVVASHNAASVESAYLLAKACNLHEQISFAQLLGMRDHLTDKLARSVFRTYKYLPYGPVADVMPYLARRALENAAMFSRESLKSDQKGYSNEAKQRNEDE